jgi:hypothetical protein
VLRPLGANIGFGYIGDDDDSDDTGGSGADTFDATVALSPSSTGINTNVTATLSISSSSGQTNGSVWLTIFNVSYTGGTSVVGSFVTVTLDGWSQSGWTYDVGFNAWFNHLTRASVPVGTTHPQFTFQSSHAGAANASTQVVGGSSATAPQTDNASGAGGFSTVVFTQSFDALTTTDFSSIAANNPVTLSIVVAASGVPQGNGHFVAQIDQSADDMLNAPTTINLAGWTTTGWSFDVGLNAWRASFSMTTIIGNSTLQFSFTPLRSGTVTPRTNVSPLPGTDQASGIGTITPVTVT